MNTISRCSLLVFILLVGSLSGFQTAQAADESQLVTRVYPVADLIFTPPNYPFQGVEIDMPVRSTLPMGTGGGSGMGGMGGGMMGGGGFGGAPYDGKQTANVSGIAPAAPSIEQLTKVIQETVATPTWSQFGGTATMTVYGSRLIISQSNRAHEEIKTLLSALRASGAVQSTVTIRAWWLRLDATEYRQLLAELPAASPPLANRKQLEMLATAKTTDFGEVTCFDGQTVHIISGRSRNAVVGVTPVVGEFWPLPMQPHKESQLAVVDSARPSSIVKLSRSQSDSIFHFAAFSNDGDAPPAFGGGGDSQVNNNVGYQPTSAKLHAGAMLEVTPTRLQDGNAIVLDLRSKFSQWDEHAEALEFNHVVKLDQTSVVSQQLSTTVKAPAGKPVLIGGLSLQPGAASDDGKSQLFLVVEAVVGG